MTNTAKVIASFNWGWISIATDTNTAWVVRENGHMNKADVVEALAAEGFKLASAGRDPRVPYIRARKYDIAAA